MSSISDNNSIDAAAADESNLLDSYRTVDNWSTYASQFKAIEDCPDVCC